jgi:class 3 adenylate cyclase
MDIAEVRYAWSGDVALAYQIVGEGSADLVYLPAFAWNLEWNWRHPLHERFMRRLAGFSRLIVTDRRGSGCSDGLVPGDMPTLETLAGDIVTLLEDIGLAGANLFACQDAGFIACLAAATYPERVRTLILYASAPSWRRTDDMPWQWSDDRCEAAISAMHGWGSRIYASSYIRDHLPSLADDEDVNEYITTLTRLWGGPGQAMSEMRKYTELDIRSILPTIQMPTLVLQRSNDPVESVESARYLTEHISDARLVVLPGEDSLPWVGESEAVIEAIEDFLGVTHPPPRLDRVLATVLFTDIVDSTKKAAQLGDARWKQLLAEHNDLAKDQVDQHRGRIIDTTGDGLLATFDGPARAVRCAQAIITGVRPLGLEVRAGCHSGEVEREGADVRGIAVHIGARIMAMAGPSEVLASSTVKDLVSGSGLVFEDRGEQELKGVPDRWRIYSVVPD